MTILHSYGKRGVTALSLNTPVDTGKTKDAWDYKIVNDKKTLQIVWTNSNVVNNVPIAIILQYGHGTRNGGYVQGIDYINPAIRPIFEEISKDIWREVIK
jgi:hypothetical protein